ncbi:MAG: formylglycine-generating enzyme family protein [Azoarcus sp.]|jgi:formylglycine-generating enzyme required for sulfatase activity|nr:formylglycine-generating enzyme family protein [Azoarcus sp.]
MSKKNIYIFAALLACGTALLFGWCATDHYMVVAPGKPGDPFVNSIGMEFVYIPAGTFEMGCRDIDEKCDEDELPRHRVTISKPFYLSKYEVTQRQWEEFMFNRSFYTTVIGVKGDYGKYPIDNVSWDDAEMFIWRLNKRERTASYRLPTEAEWEYAVRAGTSTPWFFGNDPSRLDEYREDSGDIQPVGQKKPNPRGLYDMLGNVEEWVQDWYGETYYGESPEVDPVGPAQGRLRVSRSRGGGRSAARSQGEPDRRMWGMGFRVVYVPQFE